MIQPFLKYFTHTPFKVISYRCYVIHNRRYVTTTHIKSFTFDLKSFILTLRHSVST